MTKISDIIQHLEELAPLSLQESYDNAGLITGSAHWEVSGILICLDSVEDVIDEAIHTHCNLVIAHHPIIFRGLKKLTGSNYIERTVIKAIKHDIAIYAIHTNLDNIKEGVNWKIAEKIGLRQTAILRPMANGLLKLVTFVPDEYTSKVLEALHQAGAGIIGNYDHCSFRMTGTGTFRGNEKTNPAVGKKGLIEEVKENRLELIVPSERKTGVIQALMDSHPYEEVAYYLQPLNNQNKEAGAGYVGTLDAPVSSADFIKWIKHKLNLTVIRHTEPTGRPVSRVAVCGGSGSFLLKDAINAGADAFITADFKYHEFFDAEGKLMIMDIGHYESEVFTKELIYDIINKKFSNIALRLSEVNSNPLRYS